MKTLRLHGPHDLRIHEEPQPIPQPDEHSIRIAAVGICGSDLHWFSEQGIGDTRLSQPLVLGHEFAGVDEQGRLVAVDPAIPCGDCEWCHRGHPNLCADVRFAGHGTVDGALREYIAWDKQCLFPLPAGFTAEDGVMLEPLGVAIHAVDLGHLKAGMTVGVLGCGPIGLLIVQMARLSGAATIIATDILPWRADAARAFGAHHAILVDSGSTASALLAAAGKRGADVVFEVAGTQAAVDDAVAAVSAGGKVILAGIPVADCTTFPAGLARRKGLTVKWVRRMKHTYPRAITLVARGMVDVRSLVSHRFPLAQATEAFTTAERRAGTKVIINMGG